MPAPADHAAPGGDAVPASGSPRRWLTADVETAPAAPAASGAVLAPPAASASDWLPAGLQPTESAAPPKAVDPLRWEPPPSSAGDQDAAEDAPDRRLDAAEAYCRVVCPAAAALAIAEALESAGDSDLELLHATRTAAAAHATPIAAPKTWRERLAAEHEQPCAPTRARLAERANGTLGSRDERELEDHLRDCDDCRAAAEREQEATAAFAAVLPGALGGESDAATSRWAPETLAAAVSGTAAAAATTQPARRRRRLAPLLAVAVAIVVIVAGAFAALHSSTTHHSAATPAKSVAAAPNAPGKHKSATAARHRRTAARHTSARRHHAVVHHPAHKVTHHASTTTPAVNSHPTTEPVAPVVTQPQSTSVSSVSQSSLPAQSAPQQGVGP